MLCIEHPAEYGDELLCGIGDDDIGGVDDDVTASDGETLFRPTLDDDDDVTGGIESTS
jgi:hypothetical protein